VFRFLAALASALALGASSASADDSAPKSYAGLQVLAVSGVHRDVAGNQYGAGAGALLQIAAYAKRFGIHAEGIPMVAIPQRASAFYGRSTPALSVFNAAIRLAIDARGTMWLGAGTTIINQRTPLPNLDQVVASRLAGARFEAFYRRAYGANRFVEASLGGAPRLDGSDLFIYSDGSAAVVKPERAAEEDAMLAVGRTFRNAELLFGVRSINFAAKFLATGEAADRNNGIGLMAEWRRTIDR
jgi:hypothetical protein